MSIDSNACAVDSVTDWIPCCKADIFELPFGLYPNPNNGNVLHIKYNEIEHAQAMLSIYDLRGRTIIKQQISPQIDTSSLENGIYIVEISQANFRISKKLIISK